MCDESRYLQGVLTKVFTQDGFAAAIVEEANCFKCPLHFKETFFSLAMETNGRFAPPKCNKCLNLLAQNFSQGSKQQLQGSFT
jgi:hypothetical protein